MRPFCLFSILLTLCFCGSARSFAEDAKPAPDLKPAPAAKPARVATAIPFMLGVDGRIYVKGRINNSVDAIFLIDTGSDVNFLSTAVQDKLHLPVQGATANGKPDGALSILDGEQLKGVKLASVVLGDSANLASSWFLLQSPKKLPVVVVMTRNIVTTQHVDGVVGSRTLEQFAIMLDFSASHMIVWHPSGLTKSEVKALNLMIIYTVPIAPSPQNPDIWLARMHLSNADHTAEQDMMVDTGASITTISLETAKHLNLEPTTGGTATVFHNKKVLVESASVEKMQTGDFVLLSHPVYYPNRSNSSYPISIGMDVFRGYTPLIDFGGKVMYLAAPGMGVAAPPKK